MAASRSTITGDETVATTLDVPRLIFFIVVLKTMTKEYGRKEEGDTDTKRIEERQKKGQEAKIGTKSFRAEFQLAFSISIFTAKLSKLVTAQA
jgi:hypothetical protein